MLNEHEGFEDANMRMHALEDGEHARNVKKQKNGFFNSKW